MKGWRRNSEEADWWHEKTLKKKKKKKKGKESWNWRKNIGKFVIEKKRPEAK